MGWLVSKPLQPYAENRVQRSAHAWTVVTVKVLPRRLPNWDSPRTYPAGHTGNDGATVGARNGDVVGNVDGPIVVGNAGACVGAIAMNTCPEYEDTLFANDGSIPGAMYAMRVMPCMPRDTPRLTTISAIGSMTVSVPSPAGTR